MAKRRTSTSLSRREFLRGAGTATAAVAVGSEELFFPAFVHAQIFPNPRPRVSRWNCVQNVFRRWCSPADQSSAMDSPASVDHDAVVGGGCAACRG